MNAKSRDLKGRNASHFACCAPTTDCLNILILYCKEILFQADHYGRTPLHYAVLNSSQELMEFIRKLLDYGVNINA